MDGVRAITSVLLGLCFFTFGAIFQSSKSWKDILPYLLLLALGYIFLVLFITMIVLVCIKFIIDLIEFISYFYNPFEDPLEDMYINTIF